MKFVERSSGKTTEVLFGGVTLELMSAAVPSAPLVTVVQFGEEPSLVFVVAGIAAEPFSRLVPAGRVQELPVFDSRTVSTLVGVAETEDDAWRVASFVRAHSSLSDNTLNAYASDVRLFAEWVARSGVVEPAAVTRTLVRRYIAYLSTREFARRRLGMPHDGRLAVADLSLDTTRHRVERAERRIDLTPKEFTLLEYLMRNAEQVVSRAMITEKVWGYNFDSYSNLIDVHINHLRKKMDRDFEPKLIHTVKGVGYYFGRRDRRDG